MIDMTAIYQGWRRSAEASTVLAAVFFAMVLASVMAEYSPIHEVQILDASSPPCESHALRLAEAVLKWRGDIDRRSDRLDPGANHNDR